MHIYNVIKAAGDIIALIFSSDADYCLRAMHDARDSRRAELR